MKFIKQLWIRLKKTDWTVVAIATIAILATMLLIFAGIFWLTSEDNWSAGDPEIPSFEEQGRPMECEK